MNDLREDTAFSFLYKLATNREYYAMVSPTKFRFVPCFRMDVYVDERTTEGPVSSSIPCKFRLLVGLCMSPFSSTMKIATTKVNQEMARAKDAGCTL